MTDQHRAKPEQWTHVEICAGIKQIPWATADCLLELRARVEALEATQLEQAESHRFCVDAIVRRVEALEAAQQDKLDRLIALDAADPTPDPAMDELRAASAEAQSGGLVERVGDVWSEGQPLHPHARVAAIRTVATWLDRFALHGSGEYAQAAKVLRQEVGRG
jgi:hypothetical protein